MSSFVSVEITAEAVADAMSEDGAFAFEVWETFAHRLAMGRMTDDLCDLIGQMEDKGKAKWMLAQLKGAASLAESIHLQDD